jgi:nucleoid-associated protein YgaU
VSPIAPPKVITRGSVTTAPSAPVTTSQAAISKGTRLTVKAGDSLWSLSQQALGPHASAAQIAAAWPQFYRANKALIGSNSRVIKPGEVLTWPGAP